MRCLFILFVLFSVHLFSGQHTVQTRSEIHGLLIEGIDYAGKSSVAKRIGEILSEKSINFEMNHCYISRNPIVRFLWDKAKNIEDVLESSWHHAAAAIIDLALFTPNSSIFYLQDRNWLSHDCRMKFLHPDTLMIPSDYLSVKHRPFRWNVYLTVSPEVRKERYLARDKKSPLNVLVVENIDLMNKYDQFCIDRIPSEENWIIIDTTHLSIDQIASRIMDFIRGTKNKHLSSSGPQNPELTQNGSDISNDHQ